MPPKRAMPKMLTRAKELGHNQTEAEAKLWRCLRAHQINDIHFRRQHAIGNYIVDFCSPPHKLVIELDGGQHLEQEEYDNQRTAFLQFKGYRVLRFWNSDVIKDIEGVMRVVTDALTDDESINYLPKAGA